MRMFLKTWNIFTCPGSWSCSRSGPWGWLMTAQHGAEFDENGISCELKGGSNQIQPCLEPHSPAPSSTIAIVARQRSLVLWGGARFDEDAAIVAWITIAAITVAVLIVTCVIFAAVDSPPLLTLWVTAPYLGNFALARACRRHLAASILVFFGSVFLAGFATNRWYYYCEDLHHIQHIVRAGGRPPMNCAGPIVEVGFPLMQWIAVALLGGMAALFVLTSRWIGNRHGT